jgi:hypothetical protein
VSMKSVYSLKKDRKKSSLNRMQHNHHPVKSNANQPFHHFLPTATRNKKSGPKRNKIKTSPYNATATLNKDKTLRICFIFLLFRC